MKLNRLETVLMDSPMRWATQRFMDVAFFQPEWRGGEVLEIGCGNGRGMAMIRDLLGAERVVAFDLDPDQVAKAQRRRVGAGVWVGDVNAMALGDARFHGVVDFGILHHVPDWQGAVGEVYRVLRPGGRFYVFEVLAAFVNHPVWRRLMEHPRENRFDAIGFGLELERVGFRVLRRRELLNQFAWFVAEKPVG